MVEYVPPPFIFRPKTSDTLRFLPGVIKSVCFRFREQPTAAAAAVVRAYIPGTGAGERRVLQKIPEVLQAVLEAVVFEGRFFLIF